MSTGSEIEAGSRPVAQDRPPSVVTLEPRAELWEQCFVVAPLVLIGSRDASGSYDFAPKHMATPLGWDRYFGFVCTPHHSTYRNIEERRAFTVTFPRPNQIVEASLAASPRTEDDTKPALGALPTFEAATVDGAFVRDGYFFLECELDRLVDGFGDNSLIAGRVVEAHLDQDFRRGDERDDGELTWQGALLAYLHPGRFATITSSYSFPYPADFSR